MLYENITTESELIEFVKMLNDLTHYEQYLLFNNIFQTDLLDLRPSNFKHTSNISYYRWLIKVGSFGIYSTTKINKRNPIENPDLKTGLYEKIHFHLSPDDTGISQN